MFESVEGFSLLAMPVEITRYDAMVSARFALLVYEEMFKLHAHMRILLCKSKSLSLITVLYLKGRE